MTRRVMARIACVAVFLLGCVLTALGAMFTFPAIVAGQAEGPFFWIFGVSHLLLGVTCLWYSIGGWIIGGWHWVLHPVYRASEWLGRKEDELNRKLWVELKPKTFYILTFYPPSDLVKDWREEKQIRYYDTFCEAVRHVKFYYNSGLATAWSSHPMQIHECTEGQGSKLVASYSRRESGGGSGSPTLRLHETDGQSVVSHIEDHLHYQFGDPVEDHLSEDELRENEGRRYGKLKNEVDDLKSRSHTGKEKRRSKRIDNWD